jgi:hypothetical protein
LPYKNSRKAKNSTYIPGLKNIFRNKISTILFKEWPEEFEEMVNTLNIPGGDLNADIGTQVRDALGILNCFEHPWWGS